MTADLERRVREALHDDAQRARLVSPDRPPDPDLVRLSTTPPRARPRRLIAVAATVALIAAASVALVQDARDDGPRVTTSPRPVQVFTDIPPGSTVPLPRPPLDELDFHAAVWTGTEIIVWGGIDPRLAPVGEGAAFNLATGTWRVIATAPIQGRTFANVAWTGTEMLVWGGIYRDGTVTDGAYNQTPLADGAAYDPATDTWRVLPDAPIDAAFGSDAVWTGDEFIVLGGGAGNHVAAYNPTTNRWRRLADAPQFDPSNVAWASKPVWTGTTILMTVGMLDRSSLIPMLVRYDPSTDTWHRDAEARYAALVGVPEADGVTRTAIGLPFDIAAPVDLLDDTGNRVRQLPHIPVDVEVFGPNNADGTWVGDEAMFWIRSRDCCLMGGVGTEQVWALHSATGTWRRVPAAASALGHVLAIGDILLATESAGGEDAQIVLYRMPEGHEG